MQSIKLSNGRRKFEVSFPDGETVLWEYDVVDIKLLAESLERRHGLRRDGVEEISPTTPEFLADLARALDAKGIKGCTTDAAYYVYGIVNAQFSKIAGQLQNQVDEVMRQWQN